MEFEEGESTCTTSVAARIEMDEAGNMDTAIFEAGRAGSRGASGAEAPDSQGRDSQGRGSQGRGSQGSELELGRVRNAKGVSEIGSG